MTRLIKLLSGPGRLGALALVATIVLAVAPARAALLPAPGVTAQIEYTGPALGDDGGGRSCSAAGYDLTCSATASDVHAAGGSGFGTVNAGGSGRFDTFINADAAGSNQSGSATGQLTYYFSIDPNTPVSLAVPYLNSLTVLGTLSYTPYSNDGLGNAAYGTAIFTLSDLRGNHLYQQTAAGDFIKHFVTANFFVDTTYRVDMTVAAVFGADQGVSESAQSDIDPAFSLSPEDALNYHLDFSSTPDAPAPGIPEPATWALMIGGFALAGAALRRRRGRIATT